jgi:uncharacterized phage-associated protein
MLVSTMRFVFDEAKAAQAAAYLIGRQGGAMPYIKLLKLLYLADRESFLQSGYPITGARMVSMDKGPLLSEVYDCIAWEEPMIGPWRELVSAPVNYSVTLAGETDFRKLSPYERELLDSVHKQFGHWDRWQLVSYTHGLPEWRDPAGSATPIDVRIILSEAGRSDDEIEATAAQVESIWAMRRLTA